MADRASLLCICDTSLALFLVCDIFPHFNCESNQSVYSFLIWRRYLAKYCYTLFNFG